MARARRESNGRIDRLEEAMVSFTNPMMREQLYKDGYVTCYSGMKTRQLTADQIDITLAMHILHLSRGSR